MTELERIFYYLKNSPCEFQIHKYAHNSEGLASQVHIDLDPADFIAIYGMPELSNKCGFASEPRLSIVAEEYRRPEYVARMEYDYENIRAAAVVKADFIAGNRELIPAALLKVCEEL